jgi:XRE family transcriptional regulator, regulator of sulfur utilization
MKFPLAFASLALLPLLLAAQTADAPKPPPEKMGSFVMNWEQQLAPNTPSKTGARRTVVDAPTPTLDKLHLHVTTLNPGQNTGAPHRHPQEEMVIVKEGTLEISIDGNKQTAGPGAVVFKAANVAENMTNIGTTPATYYVVQWFTPATPKN